jgi:hypothetical protein
MKLTPPRLAAAYMFLRATPPFSRWKLPLASEVEFRVIKQETVLGTHKVCPRQGHHVITISGARVGHTMTLLCTMAHEMIHLYQLEVGTATAAEHNAEFRRLGKVVCRHHGFDPKEF